MIEFLSFLLFTTLVGVITWLLTRGDDHASSQGYFLGGRSLTFPLIAGSLLLTNLSTEQLVGLNGAAFRDGLCVMVWEVIAVIALVFMAWFFLPRFLRCGVTTVPEYLGIRFDRQTQLIANVILLFAYVGILLPIILYTGARGMIGILDVEAMLGPLAGRMGIANETCALWVIVWLVGILGSTYAMLGGLRTVAVSDTLNGIGLLLGGLLITGFALSQLGEDQGIVGGLSSIVDRHADRFNSIGGPDSSVPFGTIFSGILLLNLFYWTTNQQIIQRTLGAKSLAEGQKGVLLTGALKLIGPLYLVIPGIIAFAIFEGDEIRADSAYGTLVNRVLPGPLTGFFAATMVGAIMSSYNSALNSSCTLFSLGPYKHLIHPSATEQQLVRSGKWFGWIVALLAMIIAPSLANTASIFVYLQKMNGMYFVPIFSVVLIGMLTTRVPPLAAKVGLVVGLASIATGYFIDPFDSVVASINEFHFLGIVFCWLLVVMLVIGELRPLQKEFKHHDAGVVDMTPWKHAAVSGGVLVALAIMIYATLADFSVVGP